uniref:Uncharacterized protein n=1 Tax=Rhizophora mucronata TaxID=61149 RepID=A0A2P2PD32_RHIMU
MVTRVSGKQNCGFKIPRCHYVMITSMKKWKIVSLSVRCFWPQGVSKCGNICSQQILVLYSLLINSQVWLL